MMETNGNKQLKTLKDYANFFGLPVAMNSDLDIIGFTEDSELEYSARHKDWLGNIAFIVYSECHDVAFGGGSIEYTLTFPDDWEHDVQIKLDGVLAWDAGREVVTIRSKDIPVFLASLGKYFEEHPDDVPVLREPRVYGDIKIHRIVREAK